MKFSTSRNKLYKVPKSLTWARCAGFAVMLALPQQASAEEPTADDTAAVDEAFECDRLADIFDVANSECPSVEVCSDLPEEAVDRSFRGRSHAKCASSYDDFLDLAQTCQIEIDRDLQFDTLMVMLQHRVSAYECTHRYNRDIKPALHRIDLKIEDLRNNTGERAKKHLQQLRNLRKELSQIKPTPPQQPTPEKTVAPDPSTEPKSDRQRARPLTLIDHLTFRTNIGIGAILGLRFVALDSRDPAANYTYYTYRSNAAIVASFSAGVRFPLGEARRHIIGTGLTYTLVAGNLISYNEMDPYGVDQEKLPGVHHLGPYARYGYRVHRDHFTPHLEIGGGLQGFSFGSQFLTSFGQGIIGACSLWQVLCLEAGYRHGWGGPEKTKTNGAIAYSVTLGVDVLRMASAKRARSSDT